jgi:hypothetical protein
MTWFIQDRQVSKKLPELSKCVDVLRGAYIALYEGLSGERAKMATDAVESVPGEIRPRTGIDCS